MLACFECKDADEINVSVLLLGVISSLEIFGCGSILITPSGYSFSSGTTQEQEMFSILHLLHSVDIDTE